MRTVTKFGVVLTLASAGLMSFLGRWETDHTAPGGFTPTSWPAACPRCARASPST